MKLRFLILSFLSCSLFSVAQAMDDPNKKPEEEATPMSQVEQASSKEYYPLRHETPTLSAQSLDQGLNKEDLIPPSCLSVISNVSENGEKPSLGSLLSLNIHGGFHDAPKPLPSLSLLSNQLGQDEGPSFEAFSITDFTSLQGLDLSFKPISMIYSEIPPKPMKRAGVVLPPVDLSKLGVSDFFYKFGIFPESKFGLISPIRFHFKLEPFFDMGAYLEQWNLKDFLGSNYSLENFVDSWKKLLPIPVSELTEDDIIKLFRELVSLYGENKSPGCLEKLQELLNDSRARQVINEASQGSEDLILQAFKDATLFNQPEKLRILLSAGDFVEHLLQKPANEKGESVFSEAFMTGVLSGRYEEISIYLNNPKVVQHLSTIKDEEYKTLFMRAIISAVVLLKNEVLTTLYKSQDFFNHVFSSLSLDDLVSKIYFEAGLKMALFERSEDDIEALLHKGILGFMKGDQDFLRDVMKNGLDGRNIHLVSRLCRIFAETISPDQLKQLILIPAFWETFNGDLKALLLKRVQEVDSLMTEEELHKRHQHLNSYEHAVAGHPLLADDMDSLGFEGSKAYRQLSVEEMDVVEREALKKELEQKFLQSLSAKIVPWIHSEAYEAFRSKILGQGTVALVVELDLLPEHQRTRLLSRHLSEKTVFSEKLGGAYHNIGVTSLMAQMAPLAKITSTKTSELSGLQEDLSSGKHPFINCSWGPCGDLKVTNGSFSIFSSHKELNDLLGRNDVVLIQAAGNEQAVLSDPDSTEDISGKVYAALLNRVEPEKFVNLILAINIKPNNQISDSSNMPGHQVKIQRNALSAQGCGTFWLDETGHRHRPLSDGGTSSAAPIITGAAVLLQSYKPDFSPVLIKECLLHSALREFPVYGDDETLKHVVYESPSQKDTDEKYSFAKYGMGILNVPRALAYADLLEGHLKTRTEESPMTFEEFESLRVKLPLRTPGRIEKED